MTTTTPTGLKLRALLSGAAPAIAVSFADGTPDAEVDHARRSGLDVAELRIDRYASTDPDVVLAEVRRFSALPTIATIRSQREGGDWTGSDEDRLALFAAIVDHVDAIDVELSSDTIIERAVALAHEAGKLVIVSHHDFEQTPPPGELDGLAARAQAQGADLVKISVWAGSAAEVRALAAFALRHVDLALILIAMGPHGRLSRVFFPVLGSRLTYAWGSGQPAPGQLSLDETFAALRRYYPDFDEEKGLELGLAGPA